MIEKVCSRCRESKPLDAFYSDPSRLDGRHHVSVGQGSLLEDVA